MADQKKTRRKRFVVLVNVGLQLAVMGVYTAFGKAREDARLMGGTVEPLMSPEDGLVLYKRKETE